jgi:tetratricopeptide (TPR) repeat protein
MLTASWPPRTKTSTQSEALITLLPGWRWPEAALQAATRLRPDAAETLLAHANYLYYGRRDYAGALAELARVRGALPNDPRIFALTGYILRRRGDQEGGLRNLQRAAELDPRNSDAFQQIALTYQNMRRYGEAVAAYDRALSIVPNDIEARVERARLYLCWKADIRPLHHTIEEILAQGPTAIVRTADGWFACALAERDSSCGRTGSGRAGRQSLLVRSVNFL